MLSSLLDTNLCIRALRDRSAAIRERFKAEYDTICTSTIVRYELYVGAAQATDVDHKRREIDHFLSPFPCLEFDEDAAFHAANIRIDLERKGQVIGPYDVLIAGQARSRGLKMITGNLSEFSRVEGLRCEDWL